MNHTHNYTERDGVKCCDCGYRECVAAHEFTCEERVVFCLACGVVAWVEERKVDYDPNKTTYTCFVN